ncbi:hypothetical protein GCM10023187_53960 [Nibrella viscosa]|uniref:Uncharacterized protein n=1 Tax=Nibrella viscosa TaxID=1084524 RepID=A0ABP8KZ06_9BACT
MRPHLLRMTAKYFGRSFLLRYDAQRQYLCIEASALSIIAGRTYTLIASLPTGEQVTAQCTVHGLVPIKE